MKTDLNAHESEDEEKAPLKIVVLKTRQSRNKKSEEHTETKADEEAKVEGAGEKAVEDGFPAQLSNEDDSDDGPSEHEATPAHTEKGEQPNQPERQIKSAGDSSKSQEKKKKSRGGRGKKAKPSTIKSRINKRKGLGRPKSS